MSVRKVADWLPVSLASGGCPNPQRSREPRAWCSGATACWQGSASSSPPGGTREALDPVRYLGNRSSGLMGYAVAQAAIDAGADVVLISGPTSLPTPFGAVRIDVQTAVEMKNAVEDSVKGAHAIVMSAAVADYRPRDVRSEKIKKSELGATLAGTRCQS